MAGGRFVARARSSVASRWTAERIDTTRFLRSSGPRPPTEHAGWPVPADDTAAMAARVRQRHPRPEAPLSQPSPSRRLIDPGIVIVVVLAIAGAVVTFRQGGFDAVRRIVVDDTLLLLGILPKVAAGCLIGALITLLVPRETVVRLVGSESGLRGLLIATLAGLVVPGGPFTVFPITVAFLAVGADRGAAIAFVTAWHVVGLNRAIIWEMPFFGAEFVGLRMLVSIPFPVLAGFAARLLPWPRDDGS